MAEQPKQDRVWDFGMEAYLPSDGDEQATANTLTLGATGVGKTISLNALLDADPTKPDADPDADCESAQ